MAEDEQKPGTEPNQQTALAPAFKPSLGELGELRNALAQGDTQVKSSQSLAASIRRDSELLARLDKREFLAVASDIRRKSREIENSLEVHPHVRMRERYRDDPWIADILAAELSENVSD